MLHSVENLLVERRLQLVGLSYKLNMLFALLQDRENCISRHIFGKRHGCGVIRACIEGTKLHLRARGHKGFKPELFPTISFDGVVTLQCQSLHDTCKL